MVSLIPLIKTENNFNPSKLNKQLFISSVPYLGKDEAVGGEPDPTDLGGDQTKTISQWLTKLGELRREVDRLRAHICNKYAEDMGDNITCATQ